MKEKKETGSRKNGRLGSRKSARRIPKGLIHVQASFNNTIVTVTDVRGRVVYWASAGTCGRGVQEEGHHLLLKLQREMLYSSGARYATSGSYEKGSRSRNPIFQGQEPRSQKTVRRSYF